MPIKLYGTTIGPSVTIASILKEKGIPYEFVKLTLRNGDHKKKEYMELQPWGQVPCLDDNGFIIYESRAIARYIALKYANQGTPLVPSPTDGPEVQGLFEQMANVEIWHFAVPAMEVAKHGFYKVMRGEPIDQEAFNNQIEEFSKKLDVYDQILSKQKYLAGDNITIVDFFHLWFGRTLEMVPGCDIMQRKPNVARWWNELKARPSVAELDLANGKF